MDRKLGSPTLSRLRVSCDLEIENKATITGLKLGLVVKMNLVESRTDGDDESGGNRTGGGYMLQVNSDWLMAADMWWHIWTQIGGEYVVVNIAATMKLVWWWYMAATMMMMRW